MKKASGEYATIIQHAVLKTKVKARPIPSVFLFPGLSSTSPIVSSSLFEKYVNALQSNHDIILKEYSNLRKLSQSDYTLGKDEHRLHEGTWQWNSYILKGNRQVDFACHCPKTVEILEENGNLMNDTPFAFSFFSTLSPNSKIARHHGPCNLRVRCHYPLLVPKGDLGMRFGDEVVKWEVGKPLFFDDAYEHEVWNNTNEERVVLLFDIWHPELEYDEIESIKDLFQYMKENKQQQQQQ
jgi:aspartate beta-hydroxylase